MTREDATRITYLHQIFDGEKLTTNQKDIAWMFALGFTVEQIACEKGIKPPTIRRHLESIKDALGGAGLSHIRTIILLRLLSDLYRPHRP